MKFLPIAGLVALVACSSPGTVVSNGTVHLPATDSYNFYVDGSASPATVLAIDEAVRQWTEYTNVKISVHKGPEVCTVMTGCFVVYEVQQIALDKLTDSSYIGFTTLGVMTVAANLPWDKLQDTMVHEFGHALGLSHHSTFAVMNPDYGKGADHVVCDDVQQFYAVRNQSAPKTPACSNTHGALDETPDGGPSSVIVQKPAYPVDFDAAAHELGY